MAREYGLDLRQLLWGSGRIGCRRLQSLINGLPLDGALARSYDPDRLGHGWGATQELLAIIAELIDRADLNFIASHVKRGTPLPRPIYLARPDDAKRGRGKTQTDPAAFKRFLASRGIPVVRKQKDKTSE